MRERRPQMFRQRDVTAALRRLAEAGCSAHEIASITGHRTLAEVQRYADAADQVILAERAVSRTLIGKPIGKPRRKA